MLNNNTNNNRLYNSNIKPENSNNMPILSRGKIAPLNNPTLKSSTSNLAKPITATTNNNTNKNTHKATGTIWPEIPANLHTVITNNDLSTKKTYTLGDLLGEGGFAKCYRIRDELNMSYALKVIHKHSLKSSKHKAKLRSEIKINSLLNHYNIVRFIHCFEDNNYVYMVLELCEKHTLMDLLKNRKRITEEETRYYLKQILNGVEHMHLHRIIHRDLKLGNIFLYNKTNVKIGDFGLAAQLMPYEDRKKTICGTPNYIAPEVLFNGELGHSFEADIWSIGIIMYTLLIGVPPFQTRDTNRIYARIKNVDYSFPAQCPISIEAKKLIALMLNKIPEARPSIKEIKSHKFFSSGYTPLSLPESILTLKPTLSLLKEHDNNNNNAEAIIINEKQTIKETKITTPNNNIIENNNIAKTIKNNVIMDNNKPILESISHTLQIVVDYFKKNRTLKGLDQNYNNVIDKNETPIFLNKWIDHGEKYGLGYQLTDLTTGVFFKDASTIVKLNNSVKYTYICYAQINSKTAIKKTVFEEENVPSEIAKKLKLFVMYKKYMEQNLSSSAPIISTTTSATNNNIIDESVNYLSKFVRSKHAVMFRLESRVVQVNFYDHTKVIVSNEGKTITFIDTKGKITTMSIVDVIKDHCRKMSPENKLNNEQQQHQTILSRVLYVRDMIDHMLARKARLNNNINNN